MNVRETPRALAREVEWEFAQSTYAQVLAEVPPGLFPWWSQHAHRAFPGIPRDASFYAQAAEGLMMFFDCASASATACALPSRAADAVWQAWMQMDAAGLERFCIRHFGRAIPHVGQLPPESMGRALAACLVQARRRASKPATGPDLPRLFTLDARLGMPRGFAYTSIGGRVACSELDELGQPDGQASCATAPFYPSWTGMGAGAAGEGDGVSGDGDGAAACGADWGAEP